MHSLKIVPHGIVKGGVCNYSFGEDGHVVYSGLVKVGISFITKSFPFKGERDVDVHLLKSSSYKVGVNVDLHPLHFSVQEVNGHEAHAMLIIEDIGSGDAVLDLSEDIVRIKRLDVKGKFKGYSFELEAVD